MCLGLSCCEQCLTGMCSKSRRKLELISAIWPNCLQSEFLCSRRQRRLSNCPICTAACRLLQAAREAIQIEGVLRLGEEAGRQGAQVNLTDGLIQGHSLPSPVPRSLLMAGLGVCRHREAVRERLGLPCMRGQHWIPLLGDEAYAGCCCGPGGVPGAYRLGLRQRINGGGVGGDFGGDGSRSRRSHRANGAGWEVCWKFQRAQSLGMHQGSGKGCM